LNFERLGEGFFTQIWEFLWDPGNQGSETGTAKAYPGREASGALLRRQENENQKRAGPIGEV
jgi:hypothetical protein